MNGPRVRCRGCDAPGVPLPPSGSTVSRSLASGWIAVATSQGTVLKFCETCAEKLALAASVIADLAGTRHVHFANLLAKSARATPGGDA